MFFEIFDHLDGKSSLPPSQFFGQHVEIANTFLQPEDRNVGNSEVSSHKGRERGAFLVGIVSLESIS